MNSVQKVVKLCSDRGISIHKLEMACGFGNGYIKQLRKGAVPADRLYKIAQYFSVSLDSLLPDEQKENPPVKTDGYTDDEIIRAIRAADDHTRELVLLALKLR